MLMAFNFTLKQQYGIKNETDTNKRIVLNTLMFNNTHPHYDKSRIVLNTNIIKT